MDKGYIKLYRQLKDWRYWNNNNAVILWLHILMNANWQEKEWNDIVISKGSFVTSYEKLAEECNMRVGQVRWWLSKFNNKEITLTTTNRYTLISVIKWEFFQSQDIVNDTQTTNTTTLKQQSNNKQTTTTKEYKEIEEYKNKNNTSFSSQKEELGYDPKDYDFGWFNFNTRDE